MAPCIVHGLLGCFFITSARVGLVFLTPVFENFPQDFIILQQAVLLILWNVFVILLAKD